MEIHLQNNFIITILMFISTCSQNFIDTINGTSIENTTESKEIVKNRDLNKVDLIINEEDKVDLIINGKGRILYDNRLIRVSDLAHFAKRELAKNKNTIFSIKMHIDTRYKDAIGVINILQKDINATTEIFVLDSIDFNLMTMPDPPARPSIPIASSDEFDDEDYSEFESEFDDWDDWDAPPPPGDNDAGDSEFVAYDKAPTQKAGKTIFDFLEYPKIAMDLKLEGKVLVKFFVDRDGKVDTNSIKMIQGNPVFGDAAIAAVAQSQWGPAMQRDMRVGVWIVVPVYFNLEGAND